MTVSDTPYKAPRQPLNKLARKLNWHRAGGDTLRHRFYHLSWNRHPWWDWSHRVMVLVGQDFGGNYQKPSPKTIWYRRGKSVRMWRTRYPVNPPRTYQIVTDHSELQALTADLDENSDAFYEWRAICAGQDGDLHLGRMYWGGSYHGLDHWEMELLRRWLNRWRLRNWFGLRSWIYSQALESAVNQRKPFSCQQVPQPGSGGYSHWHCKLPKNHSGPHRYNNAEFK